MRYLFLAALFLIACASVETRKAERQGRLQGRIGKPVEALVEEVGAPTRSVPKGPPGEFLYVYEWGSDPADCSVTYVVKNGVVSAASQGMKYDYCY